MFNSDDTKRQWRRRRWRWRQQQRRQQRWTVACRLLSCAVFRSRSSESICFMNFTGFEILLRPPFRLAACLPACLPLSAFLTYLQLVANAASDCDLHHHEAHSIVRNQTSSQRAGRSIPQPLLLLAIPFRYRWPGKIWLSSGLTRTISFFVSRGSVFGVLLWHFFAVCFFYFQFTANNKEFCAQIVMEMKWNESYQLQMKA